MSDTEYILIKEENAWEIARAFLDHRGVNSSISHPTILAVKDKKVIGILGTHTENNVIQAEPLVVDFPEGNDAIIALNLVQNYEEALLEVGVTSFSFSTYEDNEEWIGIIKRFYGIEPYAYAHGRAWFIRHIINGARYE